MVLLTPKFVFVAVLASLTAFSLAPTTDAAAIAMRRSHQQSISDSTEAWSSHADHPLLPLPARLASASGKQTQDRNVVPPRKSMKRQSPRDFFASQRRYITPEDLPPLLTRDYSHQRSRQTQEHDHPSETPSHQEEPETKSFVHANHVSYDRRAPDPHHHHHHHHHGNHHHHGSKHAEDVVVVKGDNDNVHIGRRSPDPHHHHHHHHHNHDDHHGHGHHGPDKVIIKGDDNNVSVHSRFRIARHQGFDKSPEHVEATQHDRDRVEKYPRSVLINSVEGEEKYLVPDDYQDQSVNEISEVRKRAEPGLEGVPGSVEIMSQTVKSEDGQRIASLVLVEPDSTMAEFGNSTFILNASENNSTQVYLVAMNVTNSGIQGEDIPVALRVPVFNPDTASIEGYCATYDPQPPAPAPLSAERCFYDEPSGPHKSQVFAYTPSTSVIRPMWFSGETDEEETVDGSNSTTKGDATVDPATPLSGNMTSITSMGEFGNSTAPPPSVSTLDNSTGIDQGFTRSGFGNDSMIGNADNDFSAKALNVTLVFTPATATVPSSWRETWNDTDSDDESMELSGTNGTKTDTTVTPLTSDASGRFNDTETGWTSPLNGGGLPGASMALPHPAPSGVVSPASTSDEPGIRGEDGKDLNVMVGVVQDEDGSGGGVKGRRGWMMKAVSTAPYKWKFDREGAS